MARPNIYDKQHMKNVERNQRRIEKLFNELAREASLLGINLDVKDDKPFSFDDFPGAKRKLEKMLEKMRSEIEAITLNGIDAEWELANKKADSLMASVLPSAYLKNWKQGKERNNEARDAFKTRKENGLALSDRVWKYSDQFKEEIEMGLDCVIRDGRDANGAARDFKVYLQHPDKLFRRVRDQHGVLHLSKKAKAFNPGRGVYRSSYKNARRLVATETNIAYRSADNLRYQQMDFVVGIRIVLSNNHTCLDRKGKPQPFTDICDVLMGAYPKEFKFVGWHPHCRCHVESIHKTKEELQEDTKRILRGEAPLPPETSVNYVGKLPSQFTDWMSQNAERIANAKSLPYFIRDNQSLIAGARWTQNESTKKDVAENVILPFYADENDVLLTLNAINDRILGGGLIQSESANRFVFVKPNSPFEISDYYGYGQISVSPIVISTFNKVAQGEMLNETDKVNLSEVWLSMCKARQKSKDNYSKKHGYNAEEGIFAATTWSAGVQFEKFGEIIGVKLTKYDFSISKRVGLHDGSNAINELVRSLGIDIQSLYNDVMRVLQSEKPQNVMTTIINHAKKVGYKTKPTTKDFSFLRSHLQRGSDGGVRHWVQNYDFTKKENSIGIPKDDLLDSAKKQKPISKSKNNTPNLKIVNELIKSYGVKKEDVKALAKKPTESELIDKIGGGDMTNGSCSSVALCYVGNNAGWDVSDFRGGKSQSAFSSRFVIRQIIENTNGKKFSSTNDINGANELLKGVVEGKKYYFATGGHATIVKRENGKLMYLELQSVKNNGWFSLDDNVLLMRYGCKTRRVSPIESYIVDIDMLGADFGFREMLEYINTPVNKQKKGAKGRIK